MNTTYNLVSDGTLTLFDRVFQNFADEDISTVTFPNDLVNLKTGKNKNTIFSKNEPGSNADMVLRLIRGSSDDQFLQNQIGAMLNDFASTKLAFGTFVLRLGDGDGNVANDTYDLKGGIITRNPDGKENTSGDTNQGVAVYNLKFAVAERNIK